MGLVQDPVVGQANVPLNFSHQTVMSLQVETIDVLLLYLQCLAHGRMYNKMHLCWNETGSTTSSTLYIQVCSYDQCVPPHASLRDWKLLRSDNHTAWWSLLETEHQSLGQFCALSRDTFGGGMVEGWTAEEINCSRFFNRPMSTIGRHSQKLSKQV